LRKEIQISGPVVGGFSGSPVVDTESQKLLGVVSNGPTQGAGNIFMAISWEHVRAIAALTRS
jgi:V8-like Glu-specific endopeptidase